MRIATAPKPARWINLTPLIDVVFLLLIFFMLAASFTKFATVQISTGTEAPASAASARDAVILILTRDGTIRFDGATLAPDDVAARIKASPAYRGKPVWLKPGRDVNVQTLVTILEVLGSAGLGEITIAR